MKKSVRASPDRVACPCGGGNYLSCCGRFLGTAHLGQSDAGAPFGSPVLPMPLPLPDTALELMRSRYTAYTLRDVDYLLASWHSSTRPSAQDLKQELMHDKTQWIGLEIRRHVPDGDGALVEFVARFKLGGRAQRLHEASRFVREGGRWLYVNGTFPRDD